MGRISPCFWFDNNALEAAEFYTTVFPDSSIEGISYYSKGAPMPEGTVLTVRFLIDGFTCTGLNGGPIFKINPSISFMVNCETIEEVDILWNTLMDGGKVLMEIGAYPFSKRFGWLADKFGVNWQIIHAPKSAQKIVPSLMFTQDKFGRAKDAIDLYTSVFGGEVSNIVYDEKDGKKTVQVANFSLGNQQFMAMDSDADHQFTFNEGVSLIADCKDQAEIDRVWDALTANGGAEVECGWLTDPFGVSWQITSDDFEQMMLSASAEQAQRVSDAVLKMVKIDMQALIDAYNNK